MKRRGFLGIDAGTQGLTVIFADEDLKILASGDGGYEMVSGLAAECYEQRPDDWESALRTAMRSLRSKLDAAGIGMEVLGIGISGQMHGEVLADAAGKPLAAARLWCDSRNEAEGHELTERLGVKCPKRLTASRWLWTIRNRPELARKAAHLTTPAGWIAHRLTGRWDLGIGDAAGMFPIDQGSLAYDGRLLRDFDAIATGAAKGFTIPPLAELLPAVNRAGEDAGTLDDGGAALLGLPAGIPVAPAEGDQPASLAGSLIAEPGMVAMSFGTSVCANSVGDRPFDGVSRSIDHFCAPDGRPINMVWLRNGTTWMNTVVAMLGRMPGAGADPFAAVMPEVVAAADDCGGIMSLPSTDDEPGVGVSRGGTAMFIGLDDRNATPGNLVKAALLATVFNLRLGGEELERQGFPRKEIVLSGGLVKTPALGQVIADAFNTPVSILDGGSEGTAFGAALMAKYRVESLAGRGIAWPAFLAKHATGTPTRFTPRLASVRTLADTFARYRRLVALHPQLDAAVG